MSRANNRALHLFCVLLAVCTFILIIAGGLVTSNDAGLSVPDWPLSYGQWMPQMVGGIFYEHGHRMIAATVGMLTVVLACWLFLVGADRGLKRLGLFALVAVVLQGVLGGLTVLLELPVAVSVLHAMLAQGFFCIVISLALFTSRSWPPAWADVSTPAQPRFRTARLLTLALFVQLLLGAVLRHSGTLDGVKATRVDFLALAGHLAGALLVAGLIVAVGLPILKTASTDLTARLSSLLLGLLVVQLGLGVGALLVRLQAGDRIQPMPVDVGVTTAHVSVGALMLAASLILTLLRWHSDQAGDRTLALRPGEVS